MRSRRSAEQGNVLICALCTILIVSFIAANVLRNCTTRFNVSSSQVRCWKESLFAAEAGGDIAYAEIRKTVLDPTHAFDGWDNSNTNKHVSTVTTFGADNLVTSTVVDSFYNDPIGNTWYRSRSRGTAQIRGLRQTGMDDRMGAGVRGDSLLRKIDFNTDHFVAAYGPNGDGVGLALVAPSSSPYPSMTRRIEQINAPITPFEAAIKAAGTFYGLGSAAYVDSYRSSAGPYDPNVRNNPSDPRYVDSQSGTVEINASVATVQGNIYGNLYTNGGTVTKKTASVSGVIDNNVPFVLNPLEMPSTATWNYVATPTSVTGNTTINPPVVNGVPRAGTPSSPNYYLITYFVNNGNLTVNPAVINGTPQETYVTLSVTGDIGSSTSSQPTINVPQYVHLKIYFTGNLQTKAENIVNTSGYAANLQFYAISPTDPSVQQTINLNSGGGANAGFSAVFYAPSANVTINGGPDITGAVVCKNFYANGNVHWHYDRRLDTEGAAVDYRIASYVEDIR
jgi:Tfp pilus assembly protein PilX